MPGENSGFAASTLFHGFPCDFDRLHRGMQFMCPTPTTAQLSLQARQWALYLQVYKEERAPQLGVPLAVQVAGLACAIKGETPRDWWRRIVSASGSDEIMPLCDEAGDVIPLYQLDSEHCDAPWQLVMLQQGGSTASWPTFFITPCAKLHPLLLHDPCTDGTEWKKRLQAAVDAHCAPLEDQ